MRGKLRAVVEQPQQRRLVREARGEAQLASAAKQVEEVAREVQMAEVLGTSGEMDRGDEALVDICASETSEGQAAWVQELASMYLGWAERRGYRAACPQVARSAIDHVWSVRRSRARNAWSTGT